MTAMLRNRLIRATGDGGDGSVVFVPRVPIDLFGFPIVRLTGWQEGPDGDGVPPFHRGPGTAPPNFIELTVQTGASELRAAALAGGLREYRLVDDPAQPSYVHEGKEVQPKKFIPGFDVEAGDSDYASKPKPGVSTIACSAREYDFE